ncbi:hypothetical protein Esti_006153 [Eimeria stiedai]
MHAAPNERSVIRPRLCWRRGRKIKGGGRQQQLQRTSCHECLRKKGSRNRTPEETARNTAEGEKEEGLSAALRPHDLLESSPPHSIPGAPHSDEALWIQPPSRAKECSKSRHDTSRTQAAGIPPAAVSSSYITQQQTLAAAAAARANAAAAAALPLPLLCCFSHNVLQHNLLRKASSCCASAALLLHVHPTAAAAAAAAAAGLLAFVLREAAASEAGSGASGPPVNYSYVHTPLHQMKQQLLQRKRTEAHSHVAYADPLSHNKGKAAAAAALQH